MDLGEFAWDGMVESFAKKVSNEKVSDHMTPVVVSVHEDSSLMECVDHMLKNSVKRVPVLNRDGAVVGMIYERDVFYEITRPMTERQARRGA
jgi:predicted transcriptional regulator